LRHLCPLHTHTPHPHPLPAASQAGTSFAQLIQNLVAQDVRYWTPLGSPASIVRFLLEAARAQVDMRDRVIILPAYAMDILMCIQVRDPL
jgi:hypothetical protein